MRIDLIFPGITLSGFHSFGRRVDQEANFMHHGLASLSAFLKSSGHKTALIDLRTLRDWAEVEQRIRKSPSRVFGISMMSCDYGIGAEVAGLIKRLKADCVVIAGGVHPTVATAEVLGNSSFDYVITGEGEYSLCNLLEALEQGRRPERLIRGEPVDVAGLPWADREIFDYERGEGRYPLLRHMRPPFVSVVISRGCPYRCRFCQPAERMVFGNTVKMRPIPDVIDELKHLRDRYRFNSFLIHDDLFIQKSGYLEQFVTEYRNNGFHQNFACQARADVIVNFEERIRSLAEAGLDCLMVGFESGSQRMLDFMDKGTTVGQNRQAAGIARKYGIKVFANVMFGLPTETKRDMDATVDFVRWMKPDYLSCAVFTPYPGTYLYEYCKEQGLLLPFSHAGYRRGPLSGAKVRGVSYGTVNLEIFKAAPQQFLYLLLGRIIGEKGLHYLSEAKQKTQGLLRSD